MKEIKSIIATYDQLDHSTTKAALATVVSVEGSSYRRQGARMLVMDNGLWIGGISGGCLEGDALKRARLAITKSTASLVTYDTSEEDAYQIGVGLGCNGIIDVLFMPLNFDDPQNPVAIVKSCLTSPRKTNILITVSHLMGDWKTIQTGKVIKYEDRHSLEILNDSAIADQMQEKISELTMQGKSSSLRMETTKGKQLTVFVEILPPEIHLVLMGHQYDVYPLTRLAKEIGWRVTIASNPLKINSAISQADEVLKYDQFDPEKADTYTAILLMSHDFRTDKINLPRALLSPAPYIGLLGPKTRAQKIFNELNAEGKWIDEKNMERIFAPAGLDIGAASPEEIGLSLIAEIRAVFSKREGGFLKLRQSTIHERG
jgi:xanthine dehydrogenase accessory factor